MHVKSSQISEKTTRVAAVGYLNARPLFEPLLDASSPLGQRFDVSLALPSEVARRVSEDEADVALMPIAAAAEIGDMRVVRGAGIGARGKVRSVVLVSDAPIESLDSVCLDLSSKTSLLLARLLLARRGLSPKFLGCTASRAITEVRGKRGAVIIGDPALAIEGRFAHTLDLAEAWHEWTGLPFVFAAWCHAEGAITREDADALRAAKEIGLARREEMARVHAKMTGLSEASLVSYLTTTLRYNLDEPERAAIERFFEEGHKIDLLPKARVRFTEDEVKTASPRLTTDTLLGRAAIGERLSAADAEHLLTHASTLELGLAADANRLQKHPQNVVTYIVDRNVNYTNVCTTSCRFCAFYRPVGHAEGYVLSREVLGKKLQEVVDAGGVQILLQGGLNPDLPIEWYEDLFRWIKREYKLGLHALSPEEILHIARLEDLTVERVLERLHEAGLDSVPGGGAEILVDRVRRKIAKAKCTSEEWLGVMRAVHHMGLRSSATMMYGTTDTTRDRVLHLLKIRDLQDETNGFTAFFCWDFQYEQGTKIAPGETGTLLYLRTQAIARLVLDNVDHIGASWVTQGPDVGQVALRFGADDYGSVMFEENVVSSAGTTFCMNADTIEARIRAAGFRSVRRNVKYDWLTQPA